MASHTYIRRRVAGHLLTVALKLTGDDDLLTQISDDAFAVRMRRVRGDLLQLRAAIEGRIHETRDPRGARRKAASDRDEVKHETTDR